MRTVTSRQTRRVCATRRISACLALAAAGALPALAPAAGTQYTWTGTSSTSWETSGNWNPSTGFPTNGGTVSSTGVPTAATGDMAGFSGAAGANQPSLTAAESIGEINFAAGSSGWNISSSSSSDTLTINGTGATAGLAIFDQATTGTNTISANLGFDDNATWETLGGTLLLSGSITSTGGNAGNNTLTIAGSGTISVTSNNTGFIDSITTSSGTLDLNGNGVLGAYVLTMNGGTLLLDNTSVAVNDRLGTPGGGNSNDLVLLNGGTLSIKGNATTAITESLGPTYLSAPTYTSSGGNLTAVYGLPTTYPIITITPATGASSSASPSLTLASLNRSPGSSANPGPVLFVNGTGLGTTGGPGYGQIFITQAPTVYGGTSTGTTDLGAGAAPENANIVPFLLGEVADAAGAVGSATGTPDTFVAYTSSGSLRPLNPFDEFSHTVSAAAAGDNIYIDGATTASSTEGINSLVINGANLTIGSGTTLTNASGALLFVTSNSVAGPGTLALSQEGLININNGMTATISAPLGGSNGFTLEPPGGTGVLNLESNSPISGNINLLSGATLQLGGSVVGSTQNASLDGFLPNASVINMTAGTINLYVANVGNTTLPPINGTATAEFITYEGAGSTTVASETISGGLNNSYNIFQGSGPVTIAGGINAPTDNSQYLYDKTSSAITFGGNSTFDYSARVYFESINPNTGTVTGQNITLSPGATFSTTVSDIYIANLNTSNTKLPPPAVFNVNGTMSSTTADTTSTTVTPIIYLGYTPTATADDYGQVTLNVTGTSANSAVVNSSIYGSFQSSTSPAVNPITSVINVGAYGTIDSNAGFIRNQLTLTAGAYTYATVNNGGTWTSVPTSGGTGRFAIGAGGDAFMEVGGGTGSSTLTVSDNGSSGTATNVYTGTYGLVINDGGASGSNAVLNVYSGGTVNYNGAIGSSGDTNFYIGTTSGENGTINVIGGTVNNTAANSPITLAGVSGVNGIININMDTSGNQGSVSTSYIRAASGATTAYVNFDGGKLAYTGTANSHAVQANLINSAFNTTGSGGVYDYAFGTTTTGTPIGGATIDSSGSTVTIPVAIQAPTGNGITSITASGTYTPFTAPPLVVISGGGGKDATAYATINSSGLITAVIITSPGFGYTSTPTVAFEDGGILDGKTAGTGGLASGTYTAPTAAVTTGADASGGLTKIDTGALVLSASNTYSGATVIEQGILALTNSTTNNISKTTIIDVGDTLSDGSGSSSSNSIPGGTAINGATLYTNNSVSGYGISNAAGFVLASGQTLSGFGSVQATGGTAAGFTLGSGSRISPGSTPDLGTNLGGSAGISTPQTGALKITTGGTSAATTVLAGGSSYYWKLNTNAGGGATFSGYSQDPTTGYTVPTLTSNNTNVSGTNWDALVVDSIATSSLSPSTPFTVNAIGFAGSGSSPVNFSNGTSYAWAIAHAADSTAANLQAQIMAGDFALNTSGTLTSSSYNGQNYGYSLDAQTDPSGGSDLMVNYAPVPEPTALALLAPAAGAMFLRRRRRATGKLA